LFRVIKKKSKLKPHSRDARMEELPSSLYNKETIQRFTTKSHTNSMTEQGLEAGFTECHCNASNYL